MIKPTKDEVHLTIFGLSRWWFWLIAIGGTMFVVTTLGWMVKPWYLGLERKAYVASPQYVESRRTELVTMLTQATGIETSLANPAVSDTLKAALRNQKTTIVDRMRTAAAEIPSDAVPAAVTRYLSRN